VVASNPGEIDVAQRSGSLATMWNTTMWNASDLCHDVECYAVSRAFHNVVRGL